MQIKLTDRCGPIAPELREFAERRLRFAVSRYGSRIRRICVVFNDTTPQPPSMPACCRVSARLRDGQDVTVSISGTDAQSCIAAASDRLGRTLSRRVHSGSNVDIRRQRGRQPFERVP